MAKVYSERIQNLLTQVYDNCREEDESVRERQVREWRRLKLLWEGFSQIWYSEVAHDWRIWDFTQQDEEGNNQSDYDKPLNVFRGYLETLIAALSITVPPIKCFPDDADSTLDLITARGGDKIAQLVYRHNDVSLLWLHGLFIHMTEGMVAFKSFPKSAEEFGTYAEKEYEDVDEEHEVTECPLCGYTIDDQIVEPGTPSITASDELNEFGPDDEDAPLHSLLRTGLDICPACMMQMDPQVRRDKFIVPRLTGVNNLPKTRVMLEAYGGLNVRIPNYAKMQKDCPYLILSWERNYVDAIQDFKGLKGFKDFVNKLSNPNVQGGYEVYDQWARLSPEYMGEWPANVVTQNEAWLRPSSFNFLKDDKDRKELTRLFPDGAKVIFVNGDYAYACNESLDDTWTLTENPLSDFLHFQPIGASLTSVQEITNDLISLTLQTIEHGIGQTFVDPTVLDLDAYGQTESVPGGIYPAAPKSGKSLSDAFVQMKTATLSQEVMPFYQQIQSGGQFVSGALPSLFGGSIEGSETASQYSMSRAQSMQRLQNTWKLFTTTWKRVFSKVIPIYIKEVQHDENDVTRTKDGNFVNLMIRKSELEGKMGKIELEANENIPLTWAQKKDLLLQLMGITNPEIMSILNAKENLPIIHEALGLVDFYVPGEDDVLKCYDTIKLLLDSQPMPTGDPEVPEIASIDVDPDFDSHEIIFQIVRKWAISEAGQQAKVDKPDGYKNVLLYGRAALMMMQQALASEQMATTSEGATPSGKPNPKDKEAPITGESDVQTV